MSFIDTFIQNALDLISSGDYYYSQDRNDPHAMDCSLLVITALRKAGIQTTASYTGNLESGLIKTGRFQSMNFNSSHLKRGDILLRHNSGSDGHTVIYIGNGSIAESCNKKYGLRVTNYYPNNYQTILRYKENIAPDLPLLKNGSEGCIVGLLQVFLNKYDQARLKVDLEFGPKTKEAVKNFQAKYNSLIGHPIEIDGEVGPDTWQTISTMMERSS